MRGSNLGVIVGAFLAMSFSRGVWASDCDAPAPDWLMCEDFEEGHLGWEAWFAASAFTECNGCPDGINDPARVRLTDAAGEAHDGQWALYLPAEASAGYQGASLTYRSCDGEKRAGCALVGYDELYFRTWVRLAPDHAYVHHFLSLAGTQPSGYWDSDGNAGCRPNGTRHAGTTVDFNTDHELFFYTYYPEMNCDMGGYCSGQYAQDICDGCAGKDMPCENGLECCWGNHFGPEPAVVLPRGEWVCLEMMMRLNTPGASDGEMAFWMNDALAHRQTGMHWRDIADLQLNKAWLQHYIAVDDADQSNRIWFDDMVVSTTRIGCAPGGGDTDGGDTDGGDTDGGETDGGDTDGGGTDGGGTDGGDTDGGEADGGETDSGGGSTATGTTSDDAGSDASGSSDEDSAGPSSGSDDGSGCACQSREPTPSFLWMLLAFARRTDRQNTA